MDSSPANIGGGGYRLEDGGSRRSSFQTRPSIKTTLKRFRKFIPLIKVDAAERLVYGLVTAEKADQDGEVCDYATTAPFYKALNERFHKATDGKSIAPLREMHQLSAVGVGKDIEFVDKGKEIKMLFKVVDDDAWKKVEEGVYTGFSQGGRYVKTWKENGVVHYTADPTEISLVDNPCLADATYEYVKADGAAELRKFAKRDAATPRTPERTASLRAFIKSHSLTLDQLTAASEYVAAHYGAAAAELLAKGLYNISDLTGVLSTIGYTISSLRAEAAWEGDDSEIPGALHGVLEELIAVYLDLAAEETAELLESAAKGKDTMDLEKAKNHMKALHGHLSKAVAHHGKMADMHKAHADHLSGAMECCNKAMESADDGKKTTEPEVQKAADPAAAAGAAAAPAAEAVAAAALTKEDVQNIVKSSFDEFAKQLKPAEAAPAAAAAADPTAKVKLTLFGRDGKEIKKADAAASPIAESEGSLQEVGI